MGGNGKVMQLPPELAAAVQGQRPVVIQQPMNDTQVVILTAAQLVTESRGAAEAVALAIEIGAEAILQMGPGNVGLQHVIEALQARYAAQEKPALVT